MDTFRIRPITEGDVREVVESCGGVVAHPDADSRTARGCDFVLQGAAIELKLLNENGLEKSARQRKLASIFCNEGYAAPVVVVDPENLSEAGKRQYDRAIEGPMKRAVESARQQLKQTRAERSDTQRSILWILNNGYTALNHEELSALIARRVLNNTSSIDGVIVGGCYFHSDGYDSFCLWPLEYVPIRINPFPAFDDLHASWNRFAEKFMTQVVMGPHTDDLVKGPVIDTQFEVDEITYVKPAPPIGGSSSFYLQGRPRKNSTGPKECPRVALTFPGFSKLEWSRFHTALPGEKGLRDDYGLWLRHEQEARGQGLPLKPFVRVPIAFEDWHDWHKKKDRPSVMSSIYEYTNTVFQERIQAVLSSAREMKEQGLLPSRYILAVTDEIGQDRANDLSHIAAVWQRPGRKPDIAPLFENLRIFHEHAVALASAYAVEMGLDFVLWIRNMRYAWA
ncbi:Uncharacterised protein [uncultured archaeon]|nr:Uncharacterised protein [uncultured archaeon]